MTALAPMKALGVRTLEAYAGQLEYTDMKEVTVRFPCIYVHAPSIGNEEVNNYDLATVTLQLFFGDRHLRGGADAMRADAGVYWMLETSKNYLRRENIAEFFTPLQWLGDDQIMYAPESRFVIYRARYSCNIVYE